VKEVPVILLTEVKSRIPLPHPLFCPPTWKRPCNLSHQG
jgi:hypothetical protein